MSKLDRSNPRRRNRGNRIDACDLDGLKAHCRDAEESNRREEAQTVGGYGTCRCGAARGKAARTVRRVLSHEKIGILRQLQLVTSKPVLYVANVSEKTRHGNAMSEKVAAKPS